MGIVDCMACLVTGVLTPVGFRDEHGIIHRVRWSTHGGPYRLCDFGEDGGLREGVTWSRAIQPIDLIDTEES